MQKAYEDQQPFYMCFVDFKKAFDPMMEMGYPNTQYKLIHSLFKLYKHRLAKVKAAWTLSAWFCVKKKDLAGLYPI